LGNGIARSRRLIGAFRPDRIEDADGELAPRQGAPLVAVEAGKLPREALKCLEESARSRRGLSCDGAYQKPLPRRTNALQIELRHCDVPCAGALALVGAIADERRDELVHRLGCRRIPLDGNTEAMQAGILRHPPHSGRRSRARAALRVAAQAALLKYMMGTGVDPRHSLRLGLHLRLLPGVDPR
jgi:hypothetical protein